MSFRGASATVDIFAFTPHVNTVRTRLKCLQRAKLSVNPFGVFSQRGKQGCSQNASLRFVSACFPASGVCVFVYVFFVVCWSVCVCGIHTNRPFVERLGSDDAPSSPFWLKATFQSRLLYMGICSVWLHSHGYSAADCSWCTTGGNRPPPQTSFSRSAMLQ